MKMAPVLEKGSKGKINLALMLVVELTQTVFPQEEGNRTNRNLNRIKNSINK